MDPVSVPASFEILSADEQMLARPEVARMFAASYALFEELLERPMLGPDAFSAWSRNYGRVAGKSRLVLLARREEDIVGFAEGTLRQAPPIFPAAMMGFVNHIFVQPNERQHGTARRLYDGLEGWFRERGCEAVELQVVRGNAPATRFWHGQGFADELVTMRKTMTDNRT